MIYMNINQHLLLLVLLTTGTVVSAASNSTTATSEQFIYLVFSPTCYEKFFIHHQIDKACIKLTFSKCVGYGLVAGAAIVKVPQLIKIFIDRSVYGISFTSVLMEGLTNWAMIVYNWWRGNPFSIYGENVFLLIQNIIILGLFIFLGRKVPKGVADPGQSVTKKYLVVFLLLLVTLYLTKNPDSWPSALMSSSMLLQIALFSGARLTQILHIYKCKSTGSLAIVTFILVFLGNLGRLFTVLVEITEDVLFLASIVVASCLNGFIVFQFFLYWTKKEVGDKKTQ